jgi:phospholipid/cholesterol/gamma-HCH transport system substrate-binding protein
MSQIDTFLDEGGSLIDGAQSALGRVNTVMSQEAINDFQSILANVSTFTGNIKDTDVDTQLVERVLISFEKAAKDVSAAAIAVDEAAVEFDALVSGDVKLALSRVEKSLDEVDIMLAGITKFAEGGTDLTTDGRDAINRLSNSGLTDMEETADAMRRIMLSLAEIVEELERNPAQYISGAETETMELPQ